MVAIRHYLSVKNALEALELYKKIFGAEVLSRMPVESREQMPGVPIPEDADLSKLTMHSSFKIGDAVVYMSDNFTGDVLEKTNNSVMVEPDSVEQGAKFFEKAIKANCEITMPYEKQFWGDHFGSFVDPFGISWQVNYGELQS